MRALAALACAAAVASAPAGAAPAPRFSASVTPVGAADLRHSHRPGCPVTAADLRTVRVTYWDFGGRPRVGRLVVHRRVTREVVEVFRRLHRARFPIRRMVPVARYRGSDDASMAADNTSAYNCRRAVGSTSGAWSAHAYGLAIDVNPVENPYVLGRRVLPPAGRRYLDRSRYRPGMAIAGGALVHAFAAVGWQWGGRWRSPDYQHFSKTGG